MTDEHEPPIGPSSASASEGGEEDPWIVVDDAEDSARAAQATPPWAGSGAEQEPPSAQDHPGSSDQGSFAAETWNGIPVTPPENRTGGVPGTGKHAGAGPRSDSEPAPEGGWARASTTSGSGEGAGGWTGAASASRPRTPSGGAWATARTTPLPAPVSGWGSPAGDGSTESAHGGWFAVEGDDYLDDVGESDDAASVRQATTVRLPQVAAPTFGPTFVTLTALCTGVLLVIFSIIWHPHAP